MMNSKPQKKINVTNRLLCCLFIVLHEPLVLEPSLTFFARTSQMIGSYCNFRMMDQGQRNRLRHEQVCK